MTKIENTYSPKEQAILAAVQKLVSEGNEVDSITARKIATAAGMGKSTLYEHFPSKGRILTTAKEYFLSSEIEVFRQRVENRPTFKDKVFAVYDYIFSRIDNPNSLFRVIIKGCLSDPAGHPAFPDLAARALSVFAGILGSGAAEGVISPPEDENYITMVFMGNIFSLCMRRGAHLSCRADIAGNAYDMLIKALR